MKYNYCSKLSSALPGQTTINHYQTNLRVLVNCYIICKDEQHLSLRSDSKNKFSGSSIHDGTRILVVDDNREVRDLLDTLFNQCGFIVVMANNGLEALRKFNDGGFHIVLTDICMPGINGNILSKHIKKTSADIPVIAITASPTLAEKYFDKVLTKPFNLEYLLETIQILLSINYEHQSLAGLRQLKKQISNQKEKK